LFGYQVVCIGRLEEEEKYLETERKQGKDQSPVFVLPLAISDPSPTTGILPKSFHHQFVGQGIVTACPTLVHFNYSSDETVRQMTR